MVITRHEAFKSRHSRTLAFASLATLTLITLSFLYSPVFEVIPYRLSEEPFDWCLPPPDITFPPLLKDIPPPRDRLKFDIVEGPGTEDELAASNVDFDQHPPPVSRSVEYRHSPFVAVDQLPELIYRAPVKYPEMAREAELEGVVMVQVGLDERGRVIEASVLSSSVPPILEQAALAAAKRCKFRPGKQRTVPVRTVAVIPFEFRMRR